MKLGFIDLVVLNFKSFHDGHMALADFGSGLHFVRGRNLAEPSLGSNGSGKSTLLTDAIVWCLYGRTPGGLRNPDIRPWHLRKNVPTLVGVEVEIDGEKYLIGRSASPNKLTIGARVVGEEDVAKLLGMNYDLFCNTIVMGQGQPLFFDLQPRDKMQLFVDVLELDRWDKRSEAASNRATELERDQAEAEGELSGIGGQLEQTTDLLRLASVQAEEWEAERAKRLKDAKTELAKCRKDHARIKAKRDEADLAAESASLDLKSIRGDIDALRAQVSDFRSDQARLIERRAGYERELQRLKTELAAFGETDDCPVCGQPIKKGSTIDQHKRELEDKIDETVELINKCKPSGRKIGGVEAKIESLRETLNEKDVERARREAEQALYAPMVAELSTSIAGYERDIEQGTKEPNPHQEQISKLKREKTKLLDRQADLQQEIKQLSAAVERNKFWIKGFKDIRLLVIEDVLQELEITTNAVLEEVGLFGWQVHYDIEKENKSGTIKRGLNVSILSPTARDPVRWECWSGGEGQRLRLIGALALSDVLLNHAGMQPDMEVLDEPTRHLSGEGVRDLCDFLAERAKQLGRRTFYIDHMAVESSRFSSVTTITKDKGGSHIGTE